jgi:hypothetical protein
VRWEQAPFDHPALPLANGHVGDENAVEPEDGASGAARTQLNEVPPVGASGRTAALGPLRSFAERLPP